MLARIMALCCPYLSEEVDSGRSTEGRWGTSLPSCREPGGAGRSMSIYGQLAPYHPVLSIGCGACRLLV